MDGSLIAARQTRLAARGLSVGYGGAPILQDVDFTVPSGAMTVLVGPNGCGKSTLLKTLARILTPTRGEVRLDGQPICAIPTRDVARRLALLPQGPVAPEGLTVRELVAQGRYPHQSFLRQWSAEDARAVEHALDLTALRLWPSGRCKACRAGSGSGPGSRWCWRKRRT